MSSNLDRIEEYSLRGWGGGRVVIRTGDHQNGNALMAAGIRVVPHETYGEVRLNLEDLRTLIEHLAKIEREQSVRIREFEISRGGG